MIEIKGIDAEVSVASQLLPADVKAIATAGFRTIICNRPDAEEVGQPSAASIAAAAEAAGLAFVYRPVAASALNEADAMFMAEDLQKLPQPALAYSRSGERAQKLIEMARGHGVKQAVTRHFDILIIGGGSGGIATAASLLNRNRSISLAIVEPSDSHFYQPGWTMVGAGVFERESTRRSEADLIPKGAEWIRTTAKSFSPDASNILLSDGRTLSYGVLVVCPGIKLDWEAIPGLTATLGKNGVTSNYLYETAPYTHELVRKFQGGRALFTQPAMPIKCAGAPQKAMYLSCHHWERMGVLNRADVQFHTAGAVLFGVSDYVPALAEYVERYHVQPNFQSRLIEIDGSSKTAIFEQERNGVVGRVEEPFDMIHVVPPQVAPDFIRESPLAAASGFIEIDEITLRHKRYPNIFGLGDACSASNAKTAAAVRKQAPVVAANALSVLDGGELIAGYDGYGSCPLTVEEGKVILAEFGYGGKLLPSFPKWLIDGTKPSRLAWLLKRRILPPLYWHAMLKGREWMAKPEQLMGVSPHA